MFVIFILLSIVLLILSIYLFLENKKLKENITDLEKEIKVILERKLKNNKEDLISIDNISIEPKKNEKTSSKKEPTKQAKKNNSDKISNITLVDERKKYTARTNDEYKKPQIMEPTAASLKPTKKEITEEKINTDIHMKDFNPEDYIKTNNNKENNYLEEISNQLKEEINKTTIELTDYEKEQEEQAVISYQELLSLKERLKNQENIDEDFLDDLKEFRKLLD